MTVPMAPTLSEPPVSGDIWGNCPVQGEGRFDGKPWYFRARGSGWSLEIADDPLSWDAGLVSCSGEPGVYVEEDYDGDADWMPVEEAWDIVHRTLRAYQASGGGARAPDGIGQLVRTLAFGTGSLADWTETWAQQGEPVQAAWASSRWGSMMAWLLKTLAEAGFAADHPPCPRCPASPAQRDAAALQDFERLLADHLREVMQEVPTLEVVATLGGRAWTG